MTTITQERATRSRATDVHDSPPVPVSGVVDVGDNNAFVRTAGYRLSHDDVYVSNAQVRQYGLRKGDLVEGAARPPRQGRAREKFNTLAHVDTVNGMSPGQARARPDFATLTPLYPQERLRLESDSASATARIIDLVSPVGKGQRGLIVSPPKAGKTMVLQAIAAAVADSHPDVHLMVVLVGERPEEVTDLRGRAYNLVAPSSSRILAGGVSTAALQPPRKFLGAARNIENGGSLTILSTALIETGSRMDDVFFEEFKGTGNMELRLRRELAEKRIFPAIDVVPSGTRRDDLLMSAEEHAAVSRLRRALAGLDSQQALELLLDKTRETSANAEFLYQIHRSSPSRSAAGRSSRSVGEFGAYA